METKIEKPSITETFIKYTVLFYLILIVDGYISDFCYYSFFGIPIKPYFSIEDYANEIFSNWQYLIILTGLYFFIQFYFHYTEKWIISSQSNETPRGKQRGIKIPTAQDKSRSKLRGTNPERD